MNYDQLKDKARSLPLEPGVYIMRDKTDTVIYVGKAKKLKNRVSQYFQDTASHSQKTRQMVEKIRNFDVIVAASEFEALVLENSLIKRHMPKYNILLKDDKGYPYLRLDMREKYPRLTMVNKLAEDGAAYYGPYGSRGVTQDLMEAIRLTLKLPSCGKSFPKDIGKDRPCLHYHMGQCSGWCTGNPEQKQYYALMEQVRQLLSGNYRKVTEQIRRDMLSAANDMKFELAATLRDRLNAVEALSKKQLVTAGVPAQTDVVGFAQTEANACFAVLHFVDGNLVDKEYAIVSIVDDAQDAISGLVRQYYLSRGVAPKRILLPMQLEDGELIAELLLQNCGRKPKLIVPQRGDNAKLTALAAKNAMEEALRATDKEQRISAVLSTLGRMLSMDAPRRIESYDISNISGTDIVGGMVVFLDGKPRKGEYKRFKLEGLAGQDDYASMHQVLLRRFTHLKDGDAGFSDAPDLLLIDGGIQHALTAQDALAQLQLRIPVFGMVKDDRHRTRALVTPEGKEIAIDSNPAVFSFVGNIQEETHRFAITYHRTLRSRRLRHSQLDGIPGIGPKRKQELLKTFKSITAISQATLPELERMLPKDAALAVYTHFHKE